jgi:cytochrome c-type biogenesis protein CcmH
MMLFWSLAALLLLAGLCFFLPALLGPARAGQRSRSEWNLLIHKQRRAELAAEVFDAEQAAQVTAELDRDLLTDVDLSPETPRAGPMSGRPALLGGLAAALAIGILVYLRLGQPDLLQMPTGTPETTHASAPEIETGIKELTEKLAKNPNDLDGWVLLGRSLQATGKPDKAVTAYEFAQKIAPEDPDLKALYAEALAELNQGSLTGKPVQIVEEILRSHPDHPTGLWLAGLAAAERKDISQAVDHWRRLQKQLAPDSEDAQYLAKYLARVQGLPSPTEPAPPTGGTTKSGVSVRVKVTLAEKLNERATPDDAVFIFARAAEGPPMPLAVVRKQVRDLPLEVTLDDSMAMMQNRKISSFDRIIIGARISRTGKPTPSPGDLQGLSAPLATRQLSPQSIEIRDIVD